jgi:hypothetical protein
MLAFLGGSASKLRLAKTLLPFINPPNFLTPKSLRFSSQEFAICHDLGLPANGTPSDNALIDGIKKL